MAGKTLTKMVGLLRGINVGGNRPVPMADLRALATKLGFEEVQTYIQSGNLVFGAKGTAEEAAVALEAAIEKRFGFAVPVIVRTAKAWDAYDAVNPFPDAEPKLLHLGLTRRPPREGAEAALKALAKTGERIVVQGDAVWIDFAGGVARSKLTPAGLDKAVGSTLTARNWRSVQAIGALLRPPAE